MTCVLSTGPWHHFNDHIPWSPMNSDGMAGLPPLDSKPQSQGYASSGGSDTRKSSTSSGKKRASRAGTRSVTTLSAAQLERKRANDREAQRAIRQRTKDHIDHLEGNLNELRSAQESSEKMVQATQLRNRELENENAYLRGKLHEAGISLNLPTTEGRCSRNHFVSIRTYIDLSTKLNDQPTQDICALLQHPQALPPANVKGQFQHQVLTRTPAMDRGNTRPLDSRLASAMQWVSLEALPLRVVLM